jgi:CRP-like cAMP-binding protein
MPANEHSASDEAGDILFPFSRRSPWKATSRLSESVTAEMQQVATQCHARKNISLYSAGGPAKFIYIILDGVVATYHAVPNSGRRIAAFRFAGDLIGLAATGVYLNSAVTLSSATLYRVPAQSFSELLNQKPTLAALVVKKLVHDIAEHQHHAYILARHDAVGRIAMFVEMLARMKRSRATIRRALYFPMNRSDIAGYLGHTQEAVSRAFGALERNGIVRFEGKRRFHILDRRRFNALILGQNIGAAPA